VDVRTDSANAFHERNHLNIVAGFSQMLDAAKVEADMQLGVANRLAFADQVQLVGFFQRRMVRPHGNLVTHFFSSRRFTPSLSP
jgi:hypothetical protein